ncbi:MAG: acetyl-CoA carboxylase biotin carboxyl carrier protein [Deltaproteobacteria bacterium]|nr:acetyl-CoA carboxylase biotin carboxyl carrier protein [Deltaproteobacteria bacterium]
MDIKDIKAIYKFLKETDIVEFELEGSDGKVRLKRGVAAAAATAGLVFQEAACVQPAPVESGQKKEEEPKKAENIKIITSPMVGTFYRAPSPEAPPFVELGSIVKNSQTMCIIEAMKLLNEVESDFNGKVISILVENGQPVEYGEPLFHIEVSK